MLSLFFSALRPGTVLPTMEGKVQKADTDIVLKTLTDQGTRCGSRHRQQRLHCTALKNMEVSGAGLPIFESGSTSYQ